MLSFKWIRNSFEEIWYWGRADSFEILIGTLLSIGAIAIGMLILGIDLLISPIEIIVLIVCKIQMEKIKKEEKQNDRL